MKVFAFVNVRGGRLGAEQRAVDAIDLGTSKSVRSALKPQQATLRKAKVFLTPYVTLSLPHTILLYTSHARTLTTVVLCILFARVLIR